MLSLIEVPAPSAPCCGGTVATQGVLAQCAKAPLKRLSVMRMLHNYPVRVQMCKAWRRMVGARKTRLTIQVSPGVLEIPQLEKVAACFPSVIDLTIAGPQHDVQVWHHPYHLSK